MVFVFSFTDNDCLNFIADTMCEHCVYDKAKEKKQSNHRFYLYS